MLNWPQTIISQYADSPRLLALIEAINEWISPDTDFEAFYQLMWNIRKQGGAVGYGLDVWGRIVGVSRRLTVTGGSFFGFEEAGDRTGFNQSAFWTGELTTTNFTLTDETYRFLIFAKAALNITNSSIPAINRILMELFPNRGNAYVIDGRNTGDLGYFGWGEAGDRVGWSQGPFGDNLPTTPNNMTLTYVFDFVLEPFEIAIVTVSGALPRPVGVKANARYLS